MLIRIFKIICFFVAVSFVSCSKIKVDIEDYEQVFDVQQFETQLNSITPLNDSTYIVGGKTGDVFIVQNTKVLHHYATSSDCIYTAFVDSNGGWWIGTRNDGLHHWDGKQPDMGAPTRKYTMLEKGTGYSAYNILLCNDSILVGTSNGLYRASMNDPNALETLYDTLDNKKPLPVEFRTPVVLSSDSIFYPSQDRIYYVGKSNMMWWFNKAKDIKALCLSPDSNHFYALSAGSKGNEDFLWKINKNNTNESTPIKLSFSVDHLLQVHDKLYLLSRSYLYATRIDDLEKGKPRFARVPLKRRLPEKPGNSIIYNRYADKICIVTERAVLSFPARNGMADRSGMMKRACIDNVTGSFFFLNSINEVFEYQPHLESQAQKVLELDPAADVTALHVDKGTIYYEISHSSLFKCSIYGILNYTPLWNRTKQIHIPQHPKSTALLINGDTTVYVGVKDNIMHYSLVSPSKKEDTLSNCYATRLRRINNEVVVATTLNDGLFINDEPAICCNIRFQEDYVVKDSLALLLNNHFLYLLNGRDVVDSVALKGYSRIFVSPNEYEGIAVSTDSLQWFSLHDSIILGKAKSAHIQIDGCVQKDDTLFVSTEAGVQKVYIDSLNAPTHLNAEFLTFDRSDYDKRKWKKNLVLIVGVIAFFLSLLAWVIWKLKDKDTLIQDSISTRIDELESANEYIGTDLKGEIEQVRNNFNEGKVKHIHKQIDVLKAKVKDELIQRLEEQSSDLKRHEGYDSNEGRDNETSTRNLIDKKEKSKIEELVACIENNNTWMDETKKLLEELESEKHELSLLPSLSSIDEKLRDKVLDIEKCFRKGSTKGANEKLTNYREYTEKNLDDYKKAIVSDLKGLSNRLENEINSYPINKNYASNLYGSLKEEIRKAEILSIKENLFSFLKSKKVKTLLWEMELHHKLYELYEAYKNGKKHKFIIKGNEIGTDTTLQDKITEILEYIEEDYENKNIITPIYISKENRKGKASEYHIDFVMSMTINRGKEYKTTFDWVTEWDESKPKKEYKDTNEYKEQLKNYKEKGYKHYNLLSKLKKQIKNNSKQLNQKKDTSYLAAILLECLDKIDDKFSMSDKKV